MLRNVVLILVVCRAAEVALADKAPPPRHRIFYKNVFAGRLNPLGLQDELKIGYRYRLYDSSGILWRDSHAGIGLAPTLNPAFGLIGLYAELQPIALLQLSATAQYAMFFGSMEHLQSFPTPQGDWSDSGLDELAEADTNQATTGWHVTLQAQLRAKVKNVVVRSTLKVKWADMDLRDGDTVWYDPTPDIVRPNGGWMLTNDADLLVLLGEHWIVGARHNLTHAFYDDDSDSTPHHRVGPFLAYRFYDRPGDSFNRPTLALLTGWYLQHRFRAGADVSQAIPYLALAFAFEGDLLDPAP